MSDKNFVAEMMKYSEVIIAGERLLEGYTGPLDAVQPGDFAEALRLLAFYSVRMSHEFAHLELPPPLEHRETQDFLARLQPEGTP